MPIVSARQLGRGPLRARAEARLISGTAPANGGTISMQALETLFRMACSPDTAADGLKLLHELQVHQIELDLQYAQLEASEREACQSLDHYKALYALAPVAYLVTDTNGRIAEASEAAAQLLGVDCERLASLELENVLAPASRPVIGELLRQLRDGAARASAVAERIDQGGNADVLHVIASPASAGASLLVVLTAT